MLYWAMGASEATDLLELSDLDKEVFQPCEGLAREGWLFLGGGFDRWSKEHIKERTEKPGKLIWDPPHLPAFCSSVRHVGILSCPERSPTALSL